MRYTSRLVAWHRGEGESGLALLIALSVALIVALITVGLFSLALSEYSTATTLGRSTQAFLAAEAGGERAIAYLKAVSDWSALASTGSWTVLSGYNDVAFPATGSGVASTGNYTIALRHIPGLWPATNIRVRVVGRTRGATRALEFSVNRITGVDMVLYSVAPADLRGLRGGGSLSIHGSAYFEGALRLKAGTNEGIFNDRLLRSADGNQYLNHLYVQGDLDLGTSNPSVGNPYHFVHIKGALIGSSDNYNVVNQDNIIPDPFYPRLLQEVRSAFSNPANGLQSQSGGMRFVVCQWQTGGDGSWQQQLRDDLVLGPLSGSPSEADTFFLPLRGTSCPDPGVNPDAVLTSNQYALMWRPGEPLENLIFPDPSGPANSGISKMIYIPGRVLVRRDVRFKYKGTIVVANDSSTLSSDIAARDGCAVDLNGDGTCKDKSQGRTIKARVPPCDKNKLKPRIDNPGTTFPTQDLLGLIVNGRMYANPGGSACDQELNIAALVGDRSASGNVSTGACLAFPGQVQIYGVAMGRCLDLNQVPDLWQMPDLIISLPEPLRTIVTGSGNPVATRNWKELTAPSE